MKVAVLDPPAYERSQQAVQIFASRAQDLVHPILRLSTAHITSDQKDVLSDADAEALSGASEQKRYL
jgi:hypothetical protein